jgi:hypothetical protein
MRKYRAGGLPLCKPGIQFFSSRDRHLRQLCHRSTLANWMAASKVAFCGKPGRGKWLGNEDRPAGFIRGFGLLCVDHFARRQGAVFQREGLRHLHGVGDSGFGLRIHGFSFVLPSPLEEGLGVNSDGIKQKRPSQSWDGRGIRGATQVKLDSLLLTKIPVMMQREGQLHSFQARQRSADYAPAL